MSVGEGGAETVQFASGQCTLKIPSGGLGQSEAKFLRVTLRPLRRFFVVPGARPRYQLVLRLHVQFFRFSWLLLFHNSTKTPSFSFSFRKSSLHRARFLLPHSSMYSHVPTPHDRLS